MAGPTVRVGVCVEAEPLGNTAARKGPPPRVRCGGAHESRAGGQPGGQPERPPMAARLKTRRVAHAGVLVGKREAVLPFAMTGLDRGDNMLSEVSQAEEDGYAGPHLHATLKQDETNTHLLGTERRLGAVRGAAAGTAVFSWVWGPPVPGTAPCTAPSSFRPAGHRPPPGGVGTDRLSCPAGPGHSRRGLGACGRCPPWSRLLT